MIIAGAIAAYVRRIGRFLTQISEAVSFGTERYLDLYIDIRGHLRLLFHSHVSYVIHMDWYDIMYCSIKQEINEAL